MHYLPRISALALTIALATPAFAQDADPAPATSQDGSQDEPLPEDAIIVTGERVRGQVQTDVPPVVERRTSRPSRNGKFSREKLVTKTGNSSTAAAARRRSGLWHRR